MQRQHRTALLLALSGFGLLTVGNSIAKSMTGQWPGTAVGALRYLFGTIGLCAIIWVRDGRSGFGFSNGWLHIGRGATVAFGSACFFVALNFMPIAEATVISFTSPMLTAILSAVFLREAAPRAAWVTTALAFVGVVLVLKPSFVHLGGMALLPLFTAFLMASMMILNRKVAGTSGLLLMQFLMSAAAVPFLLGITIAGHVSGIAALNVTWPAPIVIAKCMVMALSATTAHALIYAATERASAALVAPMTYVQLIMAILIGWFAFGDAPDLATYGGAVLIIGGGFYLWKSQRVSGG